MMQSSISHIFIVSSLLQAAGRVKLVASPGEVPTQAVSTWAIDEGNDYYDGEHSSRSNDRRLEEMIHTGAYGRHILEAVHHRRLDWPVLFSNPDRRIKKDRPISYKSAHKGRSPQPPALALNIFLPNGGGLIDHGEEFFSKSPVVRTVRLQRLCGLRLTEKSREICKYCPPSRLASIMLIEKRKARSHHPKLTEMCCTHKCSEEEIRTMCCGPY